MRGSRAAIARGSHHGPGTDVVSEPASSFAASGRSCLTFAGRLGESERASLGVLADRPCLAWMYHAAAERLDPLQCLGDVVDCEVRQRERVAGSASASMDANRGRARARL